MKRPSPLRAFVVVASLATLVISACGNDSGKDSGSPEGTAARAYVTTVAGVYPTPAELAVIDTGNNSVVASIPASHYSFSVAVSPDGRFAYIADNAGEDVTVVDTVKKTVAATIVVGWYPHFVVVSPDGHRAYAMVPRPPVVGVVVIDTATNSV